MLRRITFFALALTSACSSSSNSPGTTDDDTGPSVEDSTSTTDTSTVDSSTTTESGSDSTAMEASTDAAADADAAADTADVSTTCKDAGAIETEACGKCGNRARLCGDDGMWLPWGACTGEKGVCAPGDTRMSTCGKCGKRTDTCSATCGWTSGACSMEGVCNPGDSETQYGACTAAKEVKIRTCDSACMWSDFSACTAPKGWSDMASPPVGFAGRQYHTAVWTGSEMIVWGGQSSSSSYAADGAAYDLSKDSWRTLEAAPIVGRYYHTAVWTGSKMLVWGGYNSSSYKNDGAAYDPSAKSWTTISPPSTFTLNGRYYHTAVWATSTKEMIVWGGYGSSCSGTSSYCSDGAAYDPATGMWRTIAASPLSGRYYHRAVWAGSKMIVFGGYNSSSYLGDAAAYDPSTNTWTTLTPPASDLDARYQHMGAGDGSVATFWGGYGSYISPAYDRNTGATFDPSTSTWTSITAPSDTVFPNSRRYNANLWWGGGKLFVWGGYSYSASGAVANGASYDPATSTWTLLPSINAPTARYYATAVWTGAEAIIWGGYSYKADGKIYRP